HILNITRFARSLGSSSVDILEQAAYLHRPAAGPRGVISVSTQTGALRRSNRFAHTRLHSTRRQLLISKAPFPWLPQSGRNAPAAWARLKETANGSKQPKYNQEHVYVLLRATGVMAFSR